MQITNYWAQPQIPHNKASASAVSATDLLNLTAKNSASNNSGSANSSQSVISGPSPTASFSASLAAANVDAASKGTSTNTNPDFTNMSDPQMWSWINSQVASGAMTKEQSSPFINMTLNTPAQEAALTGNTTGAVNSTNVSGAISLNTVGGSNSANTTVFNNFIDLAQQYMASEDHASATFMKPALNMMLQLQNQTSQDIGADLSLRDMAKTVQPQAALDNTQKIQS